MLFYHEVLQESDGSVVWMLIILPGEEGLFWINTSNKEKKWPFRKVTHGTRGGLILIGFLPMLYLQYS